TLALQVCADPFVPVPPVGEPASPLARVATVVDVACLRKPADGGLLRRLRKPGASELRPQARSRVVAPGKCPKRALDGDLLVLPRLLRGHGTTPRPAPRPARRGGALLPPRRPRQPSSWPQSPGRRARRSARAGRRRPGRLRAAPGSAGGCPG